MAAETWYDNCGESVRSSRSRFSEGGAPEWRCKLNVSRQKQEKVFIRNVTLVHNEHFAAALWKGFFILIALEKKCIRKDENWIIVMNQPASHHLVFPSIHSSKKFRQSNQMATAIHTARVRHLFTPCSHWYGFYKHGLVTWIVSQCQSQAYCTLIISSMCKQWRYCIPFASLTLPDNPTSMKEPSMKYRFMSSSRTCWWHGFIPQDLYFSACALQRLWEACCVLTVLAEHDTTKGNYFVGKGGTSYMQLQTQKGHQGVGFLHFYFKLTKHVIQSVLSEINV